MVARNWREGKVLGVYIFPCTCNIHIYECIHICIYIAMCISVRIYIIYIYYNIIYIYIIHKTQNHSEFGFCTF